MTSIAGENPAVALQRTPLYTSIFGAAALVGLGWFGPQLGTGWVFALLLIWGAAIAALFAGLQSWILRAAGSTAMSRGRDALGRTKLGASRR
jgi:hypothetical protein